MEIETNKQKKPREVGKVFQEINRRTVSVKTLDFSRTLAI